MLSAPTVTRFGDAFDFEWPGVRIALLGIRDSGGDIKGEIEARVFVGEASEIISAPMLLNLRSPRGKAEVARALQQRDDTFPWADAIEAVAAIGLREWRKGGPILRLRDVEAPDHVNYLVDRILPENETTIVFGDGEAGKSLFSMFVSVCVATGIPLPHGLGTEEPRNVLYLDWESDSKEHKRRLKQIAWGLGIEPPDNIFFRECHRPLAEDVQMLAREGKDLEVGLWVIDSCAPACGGDPSDSTLAISTMNAMRDLGQTRLAIGHVNKVDREKVGANQTTFGSIFWRNMARSMWQLVRDHDVLGPEARFALYNRKSNNAAREKWPLGFEYRFSQTAIHMDASAVSAGSALSEGANTNMRIYQALKNGGKNTKELADLLGMTEDAVRQACSRSEQFRKLQEGTPGRYGTPAVWGLAG